VRTLLSHFSKAHNQLQRKKRQDQDRHLSMQLRCPDSTEPHQFDLTSVKIGYLSAYEK